MKNWIKPLVATACAVTLSACSPARADLQADADQLAANTRSIVVAGGCFWCVEADFDKVDGVISTTSGFSGGDVDNPSYKQVTAGGTGHYEVVEVVYDPALVSYQELVDYFWRHVDPTDPGGQFCDRGDSYRTAVFASDPHEREIAEESKAALEASGVLANPVVTPILDREAFWPAEGYHQDYYQKNPIRYRFYRTGCGRDATLARVWSKEAQSSSSDR